MRSSLIGKLRLAAWLVSALVVLVFLTQPVSTGAQLGMAVATIVAMALVWQFGSGMYARWAFLALGSLVVLRYIFWRATYTLPPLDQPINFALGLLLVAAELYCVLILVISLIINAEPLERKQLPRDDDDALPTVDVFIPTYNEDEYILATTIAAAKLMDYPAAKLTVWLLDDGGSVQKVNDKDPVKGAAAMARRVALTALCEEMGARYLTRERNVHAKAGNMNNAFLHATGEIVVVFDADHAPFKSFLRETIGHFARDPKLFLVQTPHVFLNPDPIERNLRTFQNMPSENEMFYSITQRGLDKWNGSFFCGSAALLRREALDVAGGFSGITITEDCETAFELHAKGWNSVFVDKPLIAGLQPETFESFIGQRSRWCQGMFQILLLKNPAFKKGLKPIQKLCYLSSMTFWFFPLPRMVFTFAPLLHIFFDVKIFVSSMDEAVAYTATYMVVNLMLQNYLYGKVRWPFISELYEYVQGVYLFKAIFSVLIAPRKPSFNVTAKGISLDEDHLSGLAQPFFFIFGILFLGACTAFYRYFFEPGANLMLIVGLWTSFNLMIAGVALGVVSERREPDRFPRLGIDRKGILRVEGHDIPVVATSVSAGGCSLRLASGSRLPVRLAAKSRCELSVETMAGALGDVTLTLDCIHVTGSGEATTYGFAFVDMVPGAYFALAELMYGDPDAMLRFQTRRRTHKNLFTGAAQFMRWGALEPIRALRLAFGTGRKKVVDEPVEVQAAATASIGSQPVAPAITAVPVSALPKPAEILTSVPEAKLALEHHLQMAYPVPFPVYAAASQKSDGDASTLDFEPACAFEVLASDLLARKAGAQGKAAHQASEKAAVDSWRERLADLKGATQAAPLAPTGLVGATPTSGGSTVVAMKPVAPKSTLPKLVFPHFVPPAAAVQLFEATDAHRPALAAGEDSKRMLPAASDPVAESDFDALSAELVGAADRERSDWLNPLLALAAAEMRRADAENESKVHEERDAHVAA